MKYIKSKYYRKDNGKTIVPPADKIEAVTASGYLPIYIMENKKPNYKLIGYKKLKTKWKAKYKKLKNGNSNDK